MQREIDAIAAEFHASLPRDQALAVGSLYARYSTRFQQSVPDQVRKLFEIAVRERVFVPREFIHFDLAVRGYKLQREGLGRVADLLEKKAVQVLLVFANNRVHRKMYRAVQFVEENVVSRGIRCLFANGIDTADEEHWRWLLHNYSMVDEFVVTMYASNVRAAHEGLLLRHLVFGTVSFGYQGEPIPGERTKRGRPRCKLVLDEDAARWVRQAFAWYVEDGLSIDEIARRLNADETIPLGPRSLSGAWNHASVRKLLTNPRYRGWWEYGRTRVVWQAKEDYARQVPREEPLRAIQIEELRIVSDEAWFKAQQRLADEARRNRGRRPCDGDRRSRPKLLNGFFWCPTHARPLSVGGTDGKAMSCPACRAVPVDQRPLFSSLNRTLALKLTCGKLAEVIQADPALIQGAIAACQRHAADLQRPDPTRLAERRDRKAKLDQQIRFVLANPGSTEEDRRESAERLRQLRQERGQVGADVALLEAAQQRPVKVPREEEVHALTQELDDVFTRAALSDNPDESLRLRSVVKALTGGQIELFQQGERKPHRGWLQGRFKVRLLPYLVEQALDQPCVRRGTTGSEVVIDYKEPESLDQEAERAKELYDQDLLECQIAAELGCARNWVTKLIRHWFKSRGLAVPDGRKRRATLGKKQVDLTLPEKHADAAKAMWEKGLADVQIAARLGCSPPTAAAAIAHWHTARGLPAPSHAERRAALVDRMQALYEGEQPIRDIARAVGMCTRSVTLMLRQRFESLGRPMPDGRTRLAASERKRRAGETRQADSDQPPSLPTAAEVTHERAGLV